MANIFITGGTGYLGRRLISLLLERGHTVHALVRATSQNKLPAGCNPVLADAFNADYAGYIPAGAVFVQLLGVPHPGPKKKDLFYSVDLAGVKVAAIAARRAGVGHFVYVSVAMHPASIMASYQDARAQGEAAIRDAGLRAVFIRPWYIVGPGHYWPVLFLPLYPILKLIPATAAKARALALVPLRKMLLALVDAVENPPAGDLRVVEIPEINLYR